MTRTDSDPPYAKVHALSKHGNVACFSVDSAGDPPDHAAKFLIVEASEEDDNSNQIRRMRKQLKKTFPESAQRV